LIKRLREEWLYWRYRNITRRRQLLQARLRTRFRRQPSMSSAFRPRARGTAMYMPARSGNARGLLFVAAAAAVLAVFNTFVISNLWLNLLLLAGMAYAYIRTGNV